MLTVLHHKIPYQCVLTHKEISICLWPPSSRLIALQNSSTSTKVYGLKNVQHTVFPPRHKTSWSLLGDQSIFSRSANPQNMIFLSLITWNSSHSCWCLAEENSGGFKPTLSEKWRAIRPRPVFDLAHARETLQHPACHLAKPGF